MTDRPLGDSELDRAIDHAVRDLMGAEPRADLRERVLFELAGGSSGLAGTSVRARLWPRFAFGLVAATAAIVIVVQFTDRPSERTAEPNIATLPMPRPWTGGTPIPRPKEDMLRIPPRTWGRVTGPSPSTWTRCRCCAVWRRAYRLRVSTS